MFGLTRHGNSQRTSLRGANLAQVVQRCILMATDPGDLVLDPTCGSGTTATVAEQWGRRWITIDTSRVALALARTRLMARAIPSISSPTARRAAQGAGGVGPAAAARAAQGDIRQGFVYERVPHITLKSIANNSEIDVIWDAGRPCSSRCAPRSTLATCAKAWRRMADPARAACDRACLPRPKPHAKWWEARIARQREIDATIAKAADVDISTTSPTTDPARVRVAGPFTVEACRRTACCRPSDDELIDEIDAREKAGARPPSADLASRLRRDRPRLSAEPTACKQPEKRDASPSTALTPWPGATCIGAERRFTRRRERARAPRRDPDRPGIRHASAAATSSPPRARRRRRASTC